MKGFFRALEFTLPRDVDGVQDAMPVDLDNLEEWSVGDRILGDVLRGMTPDQARQAEWRRGTLPPGQLGWRKATEIRDQANLLATEAQHYRTTDPKPYDVDIELGGGRRLSGTVPAVYGHRLVSVTYSKLDGKHLLASWIPLLALFARDPGRDWSAACIGRPKRGTTPRVEEIGRPDGDAVEVLRELVAIYDAGRREPLPLPVKTSYAWAVARHDGDDPEKAAGYRWRSGMYPGEDASPAHVRAWGKGARLVRPDDTAAAGRGVRQRRQPARCLFLPALAADAARREDPDLMEPFDLLGPLPAERSTTVLQASAGTGKTFALAGLVTRYLAEGTATLDQMLLITFSRAASQELRERVRRQIVDAVIAFDDPSTVGDNQLVAYLLQGSDDERDARKQRLRDALAGFDAATIATTHQFCQLVLKSLGVAGDTASNVTLLESLDDLTTEIVDDLYLAHFGQERDDPVLQYGAALTLAREVVNNPAAQLRPRDPEPGSEAAVRVDFAKDVLAELETRKRRLGVLSYDDLLSRLAAALDTDDSPARARMRHRWPIVMVDEFQDTDQIQWQVIDRAFSGHSTVILIGDPKQAIYAFRGGDVVTYLEAAKTAGEQKTLATNWRSDSALLERLQVVLRGAQLGDAAIVVDDVEAHHRGHRLAGAPHNDPFRLRVVARPTLGRKGVQNPPIATLREHISADLAADIRALLASGATFDGKPLRARDIAVIVERHRDAEVCFQALCAAGIPAVYTGNTDVFTSDAAADWLCLLEAFDQPHRPGMVRAAAATVFFGETAETLVAGGDSLTDRVADTLREWAAHARERGVAAVFEAAQLRGMGDRVLSWEDGERQMTDLAHVTQLLQDVAHHERLGLPGLRDWLRKQREERSGATERNRRLDSDATAVQVMTVYAAKGLQFPVVYVPFAFNRNVQDYDLVVFHDDGERCVYIGGPERSRCRRRQTARPPRGGQRRQPAELCRDDARTVAGGGVVGTGPRRTQRRPVAAAAWPSPRRATGTRPV